MSNISRDIQEVAACQRLLDDAAKADVYEAIRQGREDVTHGRVRPAGEVFEEMRRKLGMPR